VYGPKVVREASEALNQMQNRIVQLVRNRTQLLAAISHDLRTPIARAKLRAQFIDDSEYKTQLLDDLNEMEHMISETLSFAREESRREEKKNIDLVSLLQSICDDENDMEHKVIYHADAHRIAFLGRPIALKRAFTNLINNAIRYAGDAVVTIEQRGKTIMIDIEDSGPGISESELEKVFEPFYRGEQSRSRETGGVGLGLSVARDIIFAHHGKIKLKNKKEGGLSVLIELIIDPH
jgi:signal transduction histidine kinase